MAARLTVVGAGAWGTALAVQAARAGHDVTLWARDPARAALLQAARANARDLPGVALPHAVAVTDDAAAALMGAEGAILAVPAQHLRAVLTALPALPPLLLAAKGVERGTLALPLEIVAALRPGLASGVVSGPNFAQEVAEGLPAAAVIASADAGLRAAGVAWLGSPAFRLYGNDDPVGVQIGGAAKNVVALAAGAVIGAGLGENARAAVITRGLAEMSRLAAALGGRAETVAGLSGLGDLLLTATGSRSRNTALGIALGEGRALAAAMAGRLGVAEGVATAPALLARARIAGVELPICAAVAALLDGAIDVRAAMVLLLARPPRDE